MANVYRNGLHWCNPVTTSNNAIAQRVYNNIDTSGNSVGPGFNAALIVADTGKETVGGTSNEWNAAANWVYYNAKRPSEIVLRLYWPCMNTPTGKPPCNVGIVGSYCDLRGSGPELADIFYDNIVDTAVRAYSIRNFQVLNELNVEYEGTCGDRNTLSGFMYNLAYRLKRRAYDAGTYPIYLGFPGPGGATLAPGDSEWVAYWEAYKSTITHPLDFVNDYAYNWLAVHVYTSNPPPSGVTWESQMEQRLKTAYDDLRFRIPNYPHRYTEWSIQNADTTRITDMVTALGRFHNYVLGVTGTNAVDVYALHAYSSRQTESTYNIIAGEGGRIASVF